MAKFKKSKVDGYWICEDCGVAVLPLPDFINEHIEECKSRGCSCSS